MSEPQTKLPPDARSDTTRVRQGKTLGVMRWVLLLSMIAVVVAFVVAYVAVPM